MAEYFPTCKFDTAGQGFDVSSFEKDMLIGSEAFSSVDTIVTDGELSRLESFLVTDGIHFIVLLPESFLIVDISIKTGTEAIAETFSITDAIVTDGEIAKAENFSIVDSVVKSGTEAIAESFSVVDSEIFAKYMYMIIRKINVTFSAGNYVSNIELED